MKIEGVNGKLEVKIEGEYSSAIVIKVWNEQQTEVTQITIDNKKELLKHGAMKQLSKEILWAIQHIDFSSQWGD